MMFMGVEAEGVKSASSTSGVGARPRNLLTTCNRKTIAGRCNSVSEFGGQCQYTAYCNHSEHPRLLHLSQLMDPSSMRVGTHFPQEFSSASLLVGGDKNPKPIAWLYSVGGDVVHPAIGRRGTGDVHPVHGFAMRTPREIVLSFHRQYSVTSVKKEYRPSRSVREVEACFSFLGRLEPPG